ncbi:hypothetical protein CEE36_04680 [candidate division TA06 bacterium B3_TA06]|uniref:Uncharacterized protein n=1 Tax=candidate division TA06 bacterium B3_TA06 TaxID=2012487 RepID=A0A532V812_UNCT6|nr:MAG: hypothetical protein CEE36_04680 [candidate division TA06 bacterium B3_TA06]
MKRALTLTVLILAIVAVRCGNKSAEKGIVRVLGTQIKKAIQKAGPFDVDVELIRKGKVYNVRVNLKSLTISDYEWTRYPPDKRRAYFALSCAVPVGMTAMEYEGHLEFRNLVMGYKNEVWSLSIDDCVYLASNRVAKTMSKKELEEEVLRRIEKQD